MQTDAWRRELLIAVVSFGLGVFVLPIAIYWVGQRIIGEYAPEAGVLALAERIWSDLLALSPGAWALVASPYVIIQLVRLVARVRRLGMVVKPVTDSQQRR
jgi:hypothetical protein